MRPQILDCMEAGESAVATEKRPPATPELLQLLTPDSCNNALCNVALVRFDPAGRLARS
jgi:hypothetical protein